MLIPRSSPPGHDDLNCCKNEKSNFAPRAGESTIVNSVRTWQEKPVLFFPRVLRYVGSRSMLSRSVACSQQIPAATHSVVAQFRILDRFFKSAGAGRCRCRPQRAPPFFLVITPKAETYRRSAGGVPAAQLSLDVNRASGR